MAMMLLHTELVYACLGCELIGGCGVQKGPSIFIKQELLSTCPKEREKT
jgi:hypothetical protein